MKDFRSRDVTVLLLHYVLGPTEFIFTEEGWSVRAKNRRRFQFYLENHRMLCVGKAF